MCCVGLLIAYAYFCEGWSFTRAHPREAIRRLAIVLACFIAFVVYLAAMIYLIRQYELMGFIPFAILSIIAGTALWGWTRRSMQGHAEESKEQPSDPAVPPSTL
jgi:undecaprenyl pyrophosphate phosphatase UppP